MYRIMRHELDLDVNQIAIKAYNKNASSLLD